MDDNTNKQIRLNFLSYKTTLDRIIEKYSHLKDHDGGVEVDLQSVDLRDVEDYMAVSKKELSTLEAKNTALRETSLKVQDVSKNTQLDCSNYTVAHNDGKFDCENSTMGLYGLPVTDHTQSSSEVLDETRRSLFETTSQPEDQDEELEKSLSSQGSSLMELYPDMINQIGKAWHRQYVSEAADSVLRRYRRMRRMSNIGDSNHTFNKYHNSSLTKRVQTVTNKRNEPIHRPTMHKVTSLQERLEVPHSNQKRHQKPVLVMDFSCSSGFSSTKDISEDVSLNQTFTVSQASSPYSQQRAQLSSLLVSPKRPCYPMSDASTDTFLRSNRQSLHRNTIEQAGQPMYGMATSSVRERSPNRYSPAREGSFQPKLNTWDGHVKARLPSSPVSVSLGHYLKEPRKARLMPSSPSLTKMSAMSPRRLYLHDLHSSSQPKLHSPLSTSAPGHRSHRSLRRNFSFDSSFQYSSVPQSPVNLEDEFQKLYHRFVCQGKAFVTDARPCHECAKSFQSSRGHSSSALAALALSPHRSVLRKRHRELDHERSPRSKRFRDWYGEYLPGSHRYGKELFGGQDGYRSSRASPTQLAGLCNIRCRAAVSQGSSPLRLCLESHEERRMAQDWPASASESYRTRQLGLLERRKW